MMMPKYCTDEKLRRWNLGPTNCGGDYDHCKYVIRLGKQEYCGFTPARCGLWETIRDQAGCLGCEHYTRKLKSAKCEPCLSAETRINFTMNEWMRNLLDKESVENGR